MTGASLRVLSDTPVGRLRIRIGAEVAGRWPTLWERGRRFVRFGLVGFSGLVVNELLLALVVGVAGVNYLVGALLATQGSSLWNFALVELWAFRGRDHRRPWPHRLALFLGVNNVALALRGPILVGLTSGLGVNYLVSNLISLGALTVVRFALADSWIWSAAEREPVVLDAPTASARGEARSNGSSGSAPVRVWYVVGAVDLSEEVMRRGGEVVDLTEEVTRVHSPERRRARAPARPRIVHSDGA